MTRRIAWAVAADAAAVVVFVVVGRRSHDEGGNAVVEAAKVAAPFLIALAVAWLAIRAWRDPLSWRTGVIVWLGTVVDGLLLRRFVFDRSTALAFAIVATLALGVLLNGWRAVARRPSRRSAPDREQVPDSGRNRAQKGRVSS